MRPRLDPRTFLILGFLAIIAGIPTLQALLEWRRDEEIRALGLLQQPPTAPNLRSFEHRLESANWAANLVRPWFHYARFHWLRDGGSKAVLGQPGWFFYQPSLHYLLARPHPSLTAITSTSTSPSPSTFTPNFAPTSTTHDPLDAILHFRDQLAAHGIQLVLMPVPNKESVYPDRLGIPNVPGQLLLAPRTRLLLDRLRSANVEVIDLFEAFAQARAATNTPGEVPLYLAQDTHWSPAGLALAARTAARQIQRLGRLTPGLSPIDYSEHPAPVQRQGDIVKMLQAPALERSILPEAVDCVRIVRTRDGQPYQDAPEAEVLVLGDSFLRVFQGDEPGSAGFVAHLARELRQPLLSLVNDGGGSTLVRRELAARPAFLAHRKVLLWEFVERDIGLGLEGWKPVPLPPPARPRA